MMEGIWIIGTYDTKNQELNFVYEILNQEGLKAKRVDVSTTAHDHPVEISARELASLHPYRPDFLQINEGRGDAVTCMTEAVEIYIHRNPPSGILGLGGSGGTALATSAMRALPVGIPKVMVSTVASGQVAPYVGASDILMLYSITDIAGINQISHLILSNAAHALVGMVKNKTKAFQSTKKLLGLTMFGVTTKAVTQIREKLSGEYEPVVFHATGTGGRSMEKLIDSGLIKHVIDLTTTEIADLIAGGILSAGEERMDAIIRKKLPYILSVGAMDMVNFGSIDTVPEKYRNRLLYKHNPQVTLMRSNPEENEKIGKWMAEKLNRCEAPVRLFIPEKGVSALSVEGQPFYDPEADNILFETLKHEINRRDHIQIISLPHAINDPEFSSRVVQEFLMVSN